MALYWHFCISTHAVKTLPAPPAGVTPVQRPLERDRDQREALSELEKQGRGRGRQRGRRNPAPEGLCLRVGAGEGPAGVGAPQPRGLWNPQVDKGIRQREVPLPRGGRSGI